MFTLRRLSSVALFSLISLPAWAQAKPAQPSVVEMILPFGLMFVIFYFLIIRPQSKRAKQHEEMISGFSRELGVEGLLEYTQSKNICTDKTPGGKPLVANWF